MGKNQWRNRAKKKMTRNSDAPNLDNIQMQLDVLNCPIRTTGREAKIYNKSFSTKNKIHESDLVLNNLVHLHHDTVKIHGELGFPNVKTLRRDADYQRAGIPYVVLNADLAKHYNLDEVGLSAYLYWHKEQEIKAKEEVIIDATL